MIIQFDFDGTLALGDNTSIGDMYPNIVAINLCNTLYADGNTIHICTARGSKSCATMECRILKYQDKIESWLRSHKVQYHKLSFVKEYADAYIDDRAYNVYGPLNYQLLDSGFTDNKVTRFNDRVIKVTKNAQNEKTWYMMAKAIGLNVPSVYHADTDTIMLQYIIGKHEVDAQSYVDILQRFKSERPISNGTYSDYVQRIVNHTTKNDGLIGTKKLIDALCSLTIQASFAHGDFSVTNLINTGKDVYMIDPIYDDGNFQSYVIDIAKNLFSILFYHKDFTTYNTMKELYKLKFNLDDRTIETLIASESVRVATYKKSFTDISNNLIEAL